MGKFSSYVHSEGETGGGQLLNFSCAPGDVDKVKELLQLIRGVEIPITHSVNVDHGGYGRYSRYNIEQHGYAGGGGPGAGGFMEVLEIKDPPDGRHSVFLYDHSSLGADIFCEFDTVKNATNAFDKFWSYPSKLRDPKDEIEGLQRKVKCGILTPWFYATENEELIGEYVLPRGMSDDPVYRLGRPFVVYGRSDYYTVDDKQSPAIKICMGTRLLTTQRDSRSDDQEKYRVVSWDDGTVWNERKDAVPPRPLENGELWAVEAMNNFRKVLAGGAQKFDIDFIDGRRFKGGLHEPKGDASSPEGRYLVEATFEEGGGREGWVDFIPTSEAPNVIEFVTIELKKQGKTVISVDIKKREVTKGGTKWAGAFFKPPTIRLT